MFICLVYSHFIIFDLNLFFPLECSSGDLGNPLGIPRMPSMHSNRGGIATQRRGSQGDRLPNVQTCTKYERDSKRFKEIQREHNISDISDIWSTTAPRELSVWAQLLLGPHQFDASESHRSGQRIQDADRQFQGAAALPAPRQTLVNTGEHTQRVYMLTIIKL